VPLFEQLILWINHGLIGPCRKVAKCFPISRLAFRFHVLSRLSTTGQQGIKTEAFFLVLIYSGVQRQLVEIQGTVQDASGLAVQGSEVKATQTDTGVVRTATTGVDGGYVLPDLPVGPYQLEVTKEGFSKYVQTGIVLPGRRQSHDPGGTQSYNGLVLSVQHRFSRGLTTNANYTWSRCIGDMYVATQPQNPGTGYQAPDNRRFDHGNCFIDRRQNLNISAAYELPRFGNHAARILATGWRISPIFRYLTGAPITITTGVDRALNDNTFTQRPNQVLPEVYAHGFLKYLNPAAFTQPALGTLGNMGTYNVFGPGLLEIDTALSRVFRIREKKSVEVRGEAYNLPNFFLRGIPAVGFSTLSTLTTFGQITSVYNPNYALFGGGGPRLQFAAKFVFLG